MQHSRKGSAALLTSSPYKNKLQEDRKRKETRDQRKYSKIRLQKKRQSGPSDANVSVIRGEHEMKRKKTPSESSSSYPKDCEEPSLTETDEENSDKEAECLYYSRMCSRDRRKEKWIKRTKWYKWCHEEC